MIYRRWLPLVASALGIGALAAGAPAAGATAPARPAPPASSSPGVTTLSPEQRQALRDRLAELLRQDSEGLVNELRADGAVSLALDGRFQHAIVARPRAAGRPELACFDDADAALAFLARDDRRAPASHPARAPQPEERDR